VTSKRSGQNVIYHLNTTVFQDIMKWLVDVSQASGREG
jgi:hypothetical protein